MPKKKFQYKQLGSDIWYTDSLKGWFIVKENDLYVLRKGNFNSDGAIELGIKRYNSYLRLGDAKVGIENKLKERVQSIVAQQELFNKLKAEYESQEKDKRIDYAELDKQAERLKEKWGLK